MAAVQYQDEGSYRAQNIQRRSGNSRLRVEGDNGPIRSTYDVSNTSTQLILLNNRYSKDVNHLRGQSARSRSIVVPDPIRHFLSESPIDRKAHQQCFDTSSSSLGHYSDMDNNQRYRFTQGYVPINTNRHAACVGPQPIDTNPRPRTRHRVLSEKALSKSVAYCPELTKGEKLYLYNISRVYSTKNMQAINQRKYATVLRQEEQTGRYNQRDIDKYWNYIRSPRQTSWGSGKSSFTPKRTKSAPPGKRRKRKILRPETRMTERELSDNESHYTPRGAYEQQTQKEKGIIETVLAEPEDRKSDTGSHHSRGSKKSNTSKSRRKRSTSSSSSSSRSRSRSNSSSSSSSRRYSSSDTETKHKRASDGETVVQRAKVESQSKESDTQESRATDNEMSGRPDARASDTGDENTSRGKKEAYSSMSDSRGNDAHLREGHGRPKSRFGRKNVHKEDGENSDSSSSTSKSSSSSTNSSKSDNSKSNKNKKTPKKPMDKIEEQTKIDSTHQQKVGDTSVSETNDQSEITTTTDHCTSVSRNNESESSKKPREVKKKTTKSRYMERRRARTNSESSLTQSISSIKSSDKKSSQRKSSRTSIKGNESIKNNPTTKSGKKSTVEKSNILENVTEEQKKSNTTYRSISVESKLKSENGDFPSNNKDVDKIEY